MASLRTVPLAELYAEDETAWLDRMGELVRRRRLSELDVDNLAEYLSDMARRDRREVKSRLGLLMAHLLRWEDQPDRRSGSRPPPFRGPSLSARSVTHVPAQPVTHVPAPNSERTPATRRAYGGAKVRNQAIFEGTFRPYFSQWGDALEAASAQGRGIIISFL